MAPEDWSVEGSGPGVVEEDRRFLEEWHRTSEYEPGDPGYCQSLLWNASAVARGREYAEHVERYLPVHGARVLDVGCGSAGVSIAFAERGARCTALEPAGHRYAWALLRTRDHGAEVELRREEIEAANLASGSFDLVLAIDVLEHVSDYRQVVRRICDLLADRGVLYATIPNPLHCKNVLKEHHSGLFGVLLLPRTWREPYVVKIRRAARSFPVSSFPSVAVLLDILGEKAMEIVEPGCLQKLSQPERARRGWLRALLRVIRLTPASSRLGARALSALWLPRAYTLVARKPGVGG